MTDQQEALPQGDIDAIAGGIRTSRTWTAARVRTRVRDHLLDLAGLCLPVLAIGAPASGFLAYTAEDIGPVLMALSVLVTIPALLLMRSFTAASDEPTFLSPLHGALTMLHMLIVVCSMGLVPIYGLIAVIGAGLGNLPLFESALFLVFALANGAYVLSYTSE